jgi:hypothetical protein
VEVVVVGLDVVEVVVCMVVEVVGVVDVVEVVGVLLTVVASVVEEEVVMGCRVVDVDVELPSSPLPLSPLEESSYGTGMARAPSTSNAARHKAARMVKSTARVHTTTSKFNA